MKQQHSFVSRSIRSVVRDHEDLPAIHAGFLVFAFLAAALFRLGFFALLILLRMVLDLVKERDVHRRPWKKVMEGVLRSALPDISLLTFGLALSMVFHPKLVPVSASVGLSLAIFTLARGIGVTLPKLKILFDLLHVFFHMEQYLKRKSTWIGKSFTFAERASLLLLVLSGALLLLLPVLLSLSGTEYSSLLLVELLPWRL